MAERFRKKLPKADVGKSCVHFRNLDDLDPKALTELIETTSRTVLGI